MGPHDHIAVSPACPAQVGHQLCDDDMRGELPPDRQKRE